MIHLMSPSKPDERAHELVDVGDGRRLDQFGDRLVDRPAPAAVWPPRLAEAEWASADLRFDRAAGWTGTAIAPWTVALDGLTLELRPTEAGQVGLFPEHLSFWPWLRAALAGRTETSVLNLFASTGATTLALAQAGARVTHLDASRPSAPGAGPQAQPPGPPAPPLPRPLPPPPPPPPPRGPPPGP